MILGPKYPVYVPSKGRPDRCLTANFLITDEVPFHLVVEPSEADAYRDRYPDASVLVMPHDDMRLLGARNWIADHSEANGDARHWQLDDNIRYMKRWHKGIRTHVDSKIGFGAAEEFTDRYTNIGLSGFNYSMFATGPNVPPFRLNVHVYSATLVNNQMPYRWRLVLNDDTDLCLQVLAGGLCTVQFNAFTVDKVPTMTVKGGNTDAEYQGDGRLRMARMLERMWPGVVETGRRFQRPQHVVANGWKGFDNPLIRRTDLDWSAIEAERWEMHTIRTRPPRRATSATKRRSPE